NAKQSSCRRGSRPAGSPRPIWPRPQPKRRRPKPRPLNEPGARQDPMLAQADIDDSGPRQARGATERTCVVTRAVKPVDELVRFVVAPDGAVVPDLKR